MKVFLSWSGDLSLKVATAFREWLPAVIQVVRPYVSAEDIDKGTRWSTDIARELEASSFGILCITPSNLQAPWINFEAGALSKAMDRANVSPFLFNLKPSDIQGPLLQFQATLYDKVDIQRLVSSINHRLPMEEQLEDALLARSVDVWWPQLKTSLDALLPTDEPKSDTRKAARKQDEILEELLDLVRTQHKLLRSPEVLLPSKYLRTVLPGARKGRHDYDRAVHTRYVAVKTEAHKLRASLTDPTQADTLMSSIARLHDAIHGRNSVGTSTKVEGRGELVPIESPTVE
jgi:hypothetical protein